MDAEKRNWMAAFLAGFLATALGILLTMSIRTSTTPSIRADQLDVVQKLTDKYDYFK